ncbi:hypothetical protein APA_3542 [Pseudanabaena sp. lw0831]|uniref:hypothetical protein n=1 Tax=Pseudanabaena sp. lw0831 TaxID=1357935 RepID=UPI0019164DBA|nr:hypothetical protein [Pseudanabaena sp. lw0831]GBO55391.1 hypothetical protein APA_3542 [Pseudanabaena sp. lw0831]
MAKKRQLNVRLPDALLSKLEARVQETKMGMAAMVEVLLVQALQQLEMADCKPIESNLFDGLVKRVEALETKLADKPSDSQQVPPPVSDESLSIASSSLNTSERVFAALSDEELSSHLAVAVRTLNQKKDKSTFAEWTKKHDPEGMAWCYVASENHFYPIVPIVD